MQNTFIDLFAGAGGLSWGLRQAGWRELFLIENNKHAFFTAWQNLDEWPDWLESRPWDIYELLHWHKDELKALRGKVRLVAGGPPCQGFSLLGTRRKGDARNFMFKPFIEVCDLVQPEIVLIENVPSIDIAHGAKTIKKRSRKLTYAGMIRNELDTRGYYVEQGLLRAVQYGVAQTRVRHFTAAFYAGAYKSHPDFFAVMQELRRGFLQGKGLPLTKDITVRQAISDLETKGKELIPCTDTSIKRGMKQILYTGPRTKYQRFLRRGFKGAPDSLALQRHKPERVAFFKKVLKIARPNVRLSALEMKKLNVTWGSSLAYLDGDTSSRTITGGADHDTLHYSEPRNLTPRECARLQSFPDRFEFRGSINSRYLQVGNAVPPLLAEAIGVGLLQVN